MLLAPFGLSYNYNSVNRGKRCMTLNLKTEEGQNILGQLVSNADVVIHSFLPDTADKLRVDYESLHKRNPKLIHCSITGFGSKGEQNNQAGYDLMMQAFSGVMGLTGYSDSAPVRTGVSFIDMSTGLVAYGGIMTALFDRTVTGQGCAVTASLLETAVAQLGYHAVAWLHEGAIPAKQGSGIAHLVPYQAFLCSDGYILAGATNDAAWIRMCSALSKPSLAEDVRFKTNAGRIENREILIGSLEEVFKTGTSTEWVKKLEAAGVAAAPIQSLDQVLSHPQVIANDMVVTATSQNGETVRLIGAPFKLSSQMDTAASAPPQLGADTEAILTDELGYTKSYISQLKSMKVI